MVFCLINTVCKKSERFSERNFLAGEISRPREVPRPRKQRTGIMKYSSILNERQEMIDGW